MKIKNFEQTMNRSEQLHSDVENASSMDRTALLALIYKLDRYVYQLESACNEKAEQDRQWKRWLDIINN